MLDVERHGDRRTYRDLQKCCGAAESIPIERRNLNTK